MRAPLSPQARLLRRSVVGRLVLRCALCAVAFLVAAFLIDRLARGPVAEWLSSSASCFTITSAEQERDLQAYLDSRPGAMWDVQTNPVDHTVWVRDLTLYHVVKVAWFPALMALMVAAMLLLVLAAFRRMYRLVDDLSGAVAGLLTDEARPVSLPPELAVTERDLEGLRVASLARDEAARADRRRTQELMAYLVHDVRTPLTAIIGSLELAADSPAIAGEDRALVGTALRRAHEIEGLTAELFDVTRIASEPESVRLAPVDVRLLVDQVLDELEGCERRSVGDSASGTAWVAGDAGLLARALRHGFEVARAIAPAGAPMVVTGASGEGRCELSIRVPLGAEADGAMADGAVVDGAVADHLFEPFYRKGSTSGLSLAFAREVFRAHGGDMSVARGAGCITLEVSLPLARP